MKPTDLLKQQHRSVLDLLDQIERTRKAEKKRNLLGELERQLDAHMELEEEIVYPMARDILGDEVRVLEAEEEHSHSRNALARLLEADPDGDLFAARASVLKDLLGHHIKVEEKEVLPQIRKALDKEEEKKLLARMQETASQAATTRTAPRGRSTPSRRGRAAKTNGRMHAR